ncbi:MAG: hypothetical protein ACP5I6_06640 [Caldisphaera sp.]|nr:hypothetical protein [Caldisphaera sp.]
MVSKATVIMIILFSATLVSAGIGLYTYSSYAKPLKALYPQPSIYDVLSKVSYLQYKIYSPSMGNMYVILYNNITYNNGTAILYNSTNNYVMEEVTYKYNTSGLVSLYSVMGNETIPINSTYYYAFYSSAFPFSNPYTGTTTLEPFPGIGPLYAIYYIGSEYGVNWKLVSQGQPQTSSPYASINLGFVDIPFFGRNYKGIDLSITPSTTTLSSAIKFPLTMSAAIVYINGLPVATQLMLSMSSANYLLFNLTAIRTI